jgi:hypothetical protein
LHIEPTLPFPYRAGKKLGLDKRQSFCLTDKKERSCQIKPSKPESKPSKLESKHRKMQIKPSKLESKSSKQLSKLKRS